MIRESSAMLKVVVLSPSGTTLLVCSAVTEGRASLTLAGSMGKKPAVDLSNNNITIAFSQ